MTNINQIKPGSLYQHRKTMTPSWTWTQTVTWTWTATWTNNLPNDQSMQDFLDGKAERLTCENQTQKKISSKDIMMFLEIRKGIKSTCLWFLHHEAPVCLFFKNEEFTQENFNNFFKKMR